MVAVAVRSRVPERVRVRARSERGDAVPVRPPVKDADHRDRRAGAVHRERLVALVAAAAEDAMRLLEGARPGLHHRVLDAEGARLGERRERGAVARDDRVGRERRRADDRRGERRDHVASRLRASRIASSAALAPDGSLPPPCACAGAPPPFPPTSGAAPFTRFPACTPARTASSLALTNSEARSPSVPTSATTPDCSRARIALPSARSASAVASGTTARTARTPSKLCARST